MISYCVCVNMGKLCLVAEVMVRGGVALVQRYTMFRILHI